METAPLSSTPQTNIRAAVTESQVIEVIRGCFDPEIPVNIYELGLIYEIKVSPEDAVAIKMSLTSPHCPAAASLPEEVRMKVSAIAGVKETKVDVVWDPPWEVSRMSEAAKLQLGIS